mmetsp:Transcript_119197/g.282889  ORF Transcript_119197/g.282889 Transcript_119197/m.282889 type:complete len:223 (+) Transcript_119197:432-1100(+)
MIPLWIEYVKGTTVMVRKEGIAARRLSQSIPLHGAIMKAPIRTRGTEVATRGMELNKGVKNADTRKRPEITRAERPVFAPSTMPALLSLAIMTGLVPMTAPDIVAMAALEKMHWLLGTCPSCSRPAIPIKPYWTPAKSKRATNNSTILPKIMAWSLPLPGSQQEKSSKKPASYLGRLKTPNGASESPVLHAQTDMRQMPTRRAPCSLLTSIAEIKQNPMRAR